jgi:DNA-3-methyladenine glycosylase I
MTLVRCPWATSPEMIRYHDDEWGRPSHRDRHLFEMLVLEGAQAGLSWLTILRKRSAYRRAFSDFDPPRVARMTERTVEKLMRDSGIVRNRAKIEAAIGNARAISKVEGEFGTFDRFVWSFVGGKPIVNAWRTIKQIPASTQGSEAMSKELRKRGFRFVGPTICYAFMQAVGMVNDHLVACAWHDRVTR